MNHSGNSIGQLSDSSQAAAQVQPPPGFAGQIAEFIYRGSYMPVPEVAIAATLGVLAGVCGRAYRTHTGKDLALYIVLVAKSGIGKDGIHEGIPNLIRRGGVIGAERFVRQADFVSGAALHKAVLQTPGFLNLQGEFGRKLKRMSNPTDAPMQALRTIMTDLYGKRFFGGKEHSDSENSLLGIEWPAFSFLGETTPGTFLESLTPDMMEDGFMSRFLTIWHEGKRPLPNEARGVQLTTDQADYWKALLQYAVRYQTPIGMPEPTTVVFKDQDAYDKMKRFELDCGEAIDRSNDESERQAYNRAHLKALKIAGLLAVADHFMIPQINICHAAWALNAVRADILAFQRRKDSGQVGDGDHARERQLKAWLEEYLTHGAAPGYRVPPAMRENGIVTRKYLQQRTSSSPAFVKHKLGPNAALDLAMRSLVDSGNVSEVDKKQVMENYRFHGKCYRVLALT